MPPTYCRPVSTITEKAISEAEIDTLSKLSSDKIHAINETLTMEKLCVTSVRETS